MTFFYCSLIRFLTSTGTFFPAERVFPSLFTQFAPRLVSKTSSDLLPTRSNLPTKRSHSTVPPDYTCNFPSICVIFKIPPVSPRAYKLCEEKHSVWHRNVSWKHEFFKKIYTQIHAQPALSSRILFLGARTCSFCLLLTAKQLRAIFASCTSCTLVAYVIPRWAAL